jgi:hypothetical protein
MVIYDSRIVQQTYLQIRQLFKHKETPQINLETTNESKPEKTTAEDVRQEPTPLQKEDIELGKIELCELEFEKLIPFSAGTTVLVLTAFVVSFVVVMTVRGFVPNLPPLFKFFSNILLAGTIICGNNALLR